MDYVVNWRTHTLFKGAVKNNHYNYSIFFYYLIKLRK